MVMVAIRSRAIALTHRYCHLFGLNPFGLNPFVFNHSGKYFMALPAHRALWKTPQVVEHHPAES
jgi:hypothetical protein